MPVLFFIRQQTPFYSPIIQNICLYCRKRLAPGVKLKANVRLLDITKPSAFYKMNCAKAAAKLLHQLQPVFRINLIRAGQPCSTRHPFHKKNKHRALYFWMIPPFHLFHLKWFYRFQYTFCLLYLLLCHVFECDLKILLISTIWKSVRFNKHFRQEFIQYFFHKCDLRQLITPKYLHQTCSTLYCPLFLIKLCYLLCEKKLSVFK